MAGMGADVREHAQFAFGARMSVLSWITVIFRHRYTWFQSLETFHGFTKRTKSGNKMAAPPGGVTALRYRYESK